MMTATDATTIVVFVAFITDIHTVDVCCSVFDDVANDKCVGRKGGQIIMQHFCWWLLSFFSFCLLFVRHCQLLNES